MTFLTRVRVVAMSTAFGISIMTLSGGVVAQEVSPTPNAGADIFDPAVVEATPIPGVWGDGTAAVGRNGIPTPVRV